MKKFKKVFAVILSLAMILGMSMTTFAANNGSSSDSVEVSISNLDGASKVTLYRIAKGNYQGEGQNAFVNYTWAEGIDKDVVKKADAGELLRSSEITAIVNSILLNKITPLEGGVVENQGIVDKTFIATVNAGAYIAVITSSDPDYVYNPILLTASYNEQGTFEGGEINAATAMYGTEAVAKRTQPEVDKEITGGTTADGTHTDADGSPVETASVGDVVEYTVALTPPTYPEGANNKTLFVTDTMTQGLTYIPSSLKINYGADANTAISASVDTTGKLGDVATVEIDAQDTNTFYLNIDYDKICATNGVPYPYLTVTYSARVNENAVVGSDGNPNHVIMYYANNPTQGNTWKPGEGENTPDNAEGVTSKYDEEIVYTYQLAIHKIGEGDDVEKLPNAVFGIYKDLACTQLVDIIRTNEDGYAVSTSVSKGRYYIREIEAPDGYSVNTTVYVTDVNWNTATKSVMREISTTKYTTVEKEAATQPAIQAGWIYNGKHYVERPVVDGNEVGEAAYVKEITTTTVKEIGTETKDGAGTVSNIYEADENGEPKTSPVASITNTKLTSLPSTGGIGTTIFTIGGCAIMIIAAGLFFASRRKSTNAK